MLYLYEPEINYRSYVKRLFGVAVGTFFSNPLAADHPIYRFPRRRARVSVRNNTIREIRPRSSSARSILRSFLLPSNFHAASARLCKSLQVSNHRNILQPAWEPVSFLRTRAPNPSGSNLRRSFGNPLLVGPYFSLNRLAICTVAPRICIPPVSVGGLSA